MIFHTKEKDFTDAIAATAEKMKIREVYIEKDYWVTYVLKNLSLSKYVDRVIFKGGTSLSKAHKLIERFSEDVDLAILPKDGETGAQVKSMLKNIELTLMASPFKQNSTHVINSKGSRFRKTAHQYPRFVKSTNFGDASDHLILEINSFANPTPFKKMKISSMLADFVSTIDKKMIEEYQLQEIEVNVLDISRTFVEKMMGLIRAGYNNNPLDAIREKIRHIYDLHMMMSIDEIKNLFENDFETMVKLVKNDDLKNSEFSR